MSEKISLSDQATIRSSAPGEMGYVPPVDIIPLPSRGKIYPIESVLGNAESIEIRAMTAAEEDILTSTALMKQGKAISALMRSCLVNKSIDPDELVVGDRNAIMIAIRITGYGAEYRVPVTCPYCDLVKKEHEFDLSKLEIKPLGAEPVSPGVNAFSFSLPQSKKEVVVKLMTGKDDREVDQLIEKTKKATGGMENSITARLFHSIVSLGGETDRTKLSQIVRRLPARDSRALRTFIEKIVPGVKMEQEFVCDGCGQSSEVDVPMGTEFFWPSK